ncbi:MAG: 3-ketoacyl-ACP reductase [Cytophagales bacterium]|nr:3-ketoacyl-ACP reductase [Cytophagales bacterium]
MNALKPSALITGGSRGIGSGIVRALLHSGFDVIIADLHPPGKDVVDLVRFVRADIGRQKDRKEIEVFCKSDTGRLDLLVNNAGVSVETRGDMLDGKEESMDKLMNVNLKGPYFLTQSIAKWMIAERKKDDFSYFPQIVNIASLTSYASSTYMAEYALSKSAVSMMTKLYADRLAEYGISVFEIRPGIIKTSMTAPSKQKYDSFIEGGGLPIARWGLPEDVGKAVLAIAQRLLPYSTGEIINVDGGYHLRRL